MRAHKEGIEKTDQRHTFFSRLQWRHEPQASLVFSLILFHAIHVCLANLEKKQTRTVL